jgi:hypothetical protein
LASSSAIGSRSIQRTLIADLFSSSRARRTAPFGGDRERLYKKHERNQGVTEIVEMPNRGHALVIDSGWREVADTALAFVQRFVEVAG